jgi:hypothetical protein
VAVGKGMPGRPGHIRLQFEGTASDLSRPRAVGWKIETWQEIPMKNRSPSSSAASDRAGRSAQAGAQDNAKILPPSGPVDVPKQPVKPDASTPDEAARDKRAVVDNQTESNWADGAAPQPRAKNARSSLF